ncbi:hypothetical protein [Wenyingzhuangia sp. 2_MG-2023]|uniref:hypothetical protein n=1 Tax=Wenyingzhuangia sp. 2_MG-2023 TaxID=3062639 RepID=UPI0026E3929B|nr:hypothetical protein [Wenyingzhuangia sp. 2_MG-2023]MDO6739236.1 hypothetical protein [Wenyingzhuangia sp. 2_MG-2023]MDO6803858.1 hypothetical protein [Wenyingzhuangia sp. 1_MG-2023]
MKKINSFIKCTIATIVLALTFSNASAQDKVAFVEKVTSVPSQKALTFEISYNAEKDREINLELKNVSTNKWVAGQLKKVKKGEGTISMTIKSKKGFEKSSDYVLTVSIRPKGSTWKETINKQAIKPFTIGSGVKTLDDSVSFVNQPNSINGGKSVSFEVEYSAKENREINIEIKDPKTNKWIAGSTKKVEKGTGTVKITAWSKDGIPQGEGKQIILSIRPVGSTWKEIINKEVVKPVSIK